MGKLAKTVKERECLVCKRKYHTDSAGLKEHARVCAIAKRLGLFLPGKVERPEVGIIIP